MSEDFETVRRGLTWPEEGQPALAALDRIEARMGELQDEVRRLNTALKLLAAVLGEREDENERLRDALQRIAANVDIMADAHPADIARAALQGQEPTDG